MGLTLREKNYEILKDEAWLKKKKETLKKSREKPMGAEGKSPSREKKDDPRILDIM